MGIDEYSENVLLLAEVAELKANPNRLAKGTVIEARLDKEEDLSQLCLYRTVH